MVLKFPTAVTTRNFKHQWTAGVSKKALGHLQKQIAQGCSCVERQKTPTKSIEPLIFALSDPLTIKRRKPETTANRLCCTRELHLSDSINPIIHGSVSVFLTKAPL